MVGPTGGPTVLDDELGALVVVGHERDEMPGSREAGLYCPTGAHMLDRLIESQSTDELALIAEDRADGDRIPLGHFVAGQAFGLQGGPGRSQGREIVGSLKYEARTSSGWGQ